MRLQLTGGLLLTAAVSTALAQKGEYVFHVWRQWLGWIHSSSSDLGPPCCSLQRYGIAVDFYARRNSNFSDCSLLFLLFPQNITMMAIITKTTAI
jgi:hypothetical protein